MTTRALASSAVAVVLLVSRAATAQSQPTAPNSPVWLTDRRFNEGQGLRAGDFELHPAIGAQFGYDSNYLYRTDKTGGFSNGPTAAPVIPALELMVTPSLYISTLGKLRRSEEGGGGPAPIAFRAGVNGTYRELISVSSDPNAGSGTNDISQQRNFGGAADARLDILPERPWGGSLYANYTRSIQPNTVDANPDLSFNSDVVGGGAEIVAQPGSGTLDWHLGYRINATIFEKSAGTPYDNLVHQVYTQGRWKFRPRTALIYDASLRFITYSSNTATQVNLDTSTPVRARIGLDGLITERFAALAMIGWGASFYDTLVPNQPQFDSIIAQAELRWYLSASPGIAKITDVGLALSSVALGYTRDFQNSYLGSFYTEDRGYLKFSYLYGSSLVVSLEGGVGAIEYPNLIWADGSLRHNAFTDVRADATLFSEYRFTPTFGINGTLRFTANVSNVVLPVAEATMANAPVAAADEYAMEWKRFEAYLGLRWFL